ncbi:MAG: Ig-like domain-containing protein [Candidatus Protistobacter heckmanni]|nr:Ig-like domain-containing protein [Candidatus Protistobacter heckmanni]
MKFERKKKMANRVQNQERTHSETAPEMVVAGMAVHAPELAFAASPAEADLRELKSRRQAQRLAKRKRGQASDEEDAQNREEQAQADGGAVADGDAIQLAQADTGSATGAGTSAASGAGTEAGTGKQSQEPASSPMDGGKPDWSAIGIAAGVVLGGVALASGGGSVAKDTTHPTLTISNNSTTASGGAVTFTFTFSEAVSGFDVSNVAVINGTADSLVKVSDTVYTLQVTPNAGASGSLTVSVAAGGYTDAAGNASTAAASNATNLTAVSVAITAGPASAGLSVTLTRGDGTVLASTTSDANGKYMLSYTQAYSGVFILKVRDANPTDGIGYQDEASGSVDLNIELRGAATATVGASMVLNVTPLTEAAVRLAEKAACVATGGDLSAAASVANANAAVAKLYLGKTGDITAETATPVMDAAGTASTTYDAYGLLLAALSGDQAANGLTQEQVLEKVVNSISRISSGSAATWTEQTAATVTQAQIKSSLDAGLAKVDAVKSTGLATSTTKAALEVAGVSVDTTAPVLNGASALIFAENATGIVFQLSALDASTVTYALSARRCGEVQHRWHHRRGDLQSRTQLRVPCQQQHLHGDAGCHRCGLAQEHPGHDHRGHQRQRSADGIRCDQCADGSQCPERVESGPVELFRRRGRGRHAQLRPHGGHAACGADAEQRHRRDQRHADGRQRGEHLHCDDDRQWRADGDVELQPWRGVGACHLVDHCGQGGGQERRGAELHGDHE